MDELNRARSVLGVSSQASTRQIREAFRAGAKRHHPDTGGSPAAFAELRRSYQLALDAASVGLAARTATSTPTQSPQPSAPTRRRVRQTRSFADVLNQKLGYI